MDDDPPARARCCGFPLGSFRRRSAPKASGPSASASVSQPWHSWCFRSCPSLLGMAVRGAQPRHHQHESCPAISDGHGAPGLDRRPGTGRNFSAEVSTCDAIRSCSPRRSRRTSISDSSTGRHRLTTCCGSRGSRRVTGGVLGMFMAVQLSTVADALRIFYSVLIATLFFPVAGGLLWPRAGAREAMAAIVCGIVALLTVDFGTDRTGWWDPGTGASSAAPSALRLMVFNRRPEENQQEDQEIRSIFLLTSWPPVFVSLALLLRVRVSGRAPGTTVFLSGQLSAVFTCVNPAAATSDTTIAGECRGRRGWRCTPWQRRPFVRHGNRSSPAGRPV